MGPGEPGEPDDPGTPGQQAGPVEVAIVSPASGTVYLRDAVGSLGVLVALVNLEVSAEGSFARLAFETPKGDVLGNAGDALTYTAELGHDGDVTVVARAYGFDGRVVGSDEVTLSVVSPEPGSCAEWLDLYRLDWEPGPLLEGIPDPVRVQVPINGMSYRYVSNQTARETFVMDCELALSLARAAPHLRARDIVQVLDIGVYNYRCIGEGTPPNCPNGMSQHAYARGIDIAGVITGDGDEFSVEDDWVIDGSGESTCAAGTESVKDRFLHELICELKADHVWNIVLTPNYNDSHRDHFHVDLTTGADYIKSGFPDVGPDNH